MRCTNCLVLLNWKSFYFYFFCGYKEKEENIFFALNSFIYKINLVLVGKCNTKQLLWLKLIELTSKVSLPKKYNTIEGMANQPSSLKKEHLKVWKDCPNLDLF